MTKQGAATNSPSRSYWKNDRFGSLAIYEDSQYPSITPSRFSVDEKTKDANPYLEVRRASTMKPTSSASIIIHRSPAEKVFYKPISGHPGDMNMKNEMETPKQVQIEADERNREAGGNTRVKARVSHSKTESVRNLIFDEYSRAGKYEFQWGSKLEVPNPMTPSRFSREGTGIYDTKRMEEDARHAQQLKAAQNFMLSHSIELRRREKELADTVKRTYNTERSPSKSQENTDRENQYWNEIPHKYRETMLVLLCSKRMDRVDIESLLRTEKRDASWYDSLEKKAYRLKEKLREESRLVNHIIERRTKFLKEHEAVRKALMRELELVKGHQNVKRKKEFEREVKFNLEALKKKIDECMDLKKELEILIIIFSTSEEHEFFQEDVKAKLPGDRQFEFDSFALHLYNDYQSYLSKYEVAMGEYKSFYKLDYQSEEFNRRTINLLQTLGESQRLLNEGARQMGRMVHELVQHLKGLASELEQTIKFYSESFANVEDSFDLVSKLFYIKRVQLTDLNSKLDECEKELAETSHPYSLEMNKQRNDVILEQSQDRLAYLKRAYALRKLEVKKLREDPRTQYFMSLRLKESNKTLTELKGIKLYLVNLYILLNYLKESSISEEVKIEEFTRTTAKLIETSTQKLNSDSLNNSMLKELRESFLLSNHTLGEVINMRAVVNSRRESESFKPIEKSLQKMTEQLDRNEQQILKFQKDLLPFMQYDLSEYDDVKVEATGVLQDCEAFLKKTLENERSFYDFEDREGNLNEINRLQQGLLKHFRTLGNLKKRIRLEKIAKEISNLHRRVENESTNILALKHIFDNNAYFKAENYENIRFEEKESAGSSEGTFYQLADMKSDVIRVFEQSILTQKLVLPEIKACASHISNLASFLREILKRWDSFDRDLHLRSSDKSQIADFRERLEEIHTVTCKEVSDFKREEPLRFAEFLTVFSDRLRCYYEEVHNYIDRNSSIDTDKIFRELDLKKSNMLMKDYVLQLDELYKYIKRHPNDTQQEKMDILLGSIAERLTEKDSVEKILTWDVESLDINIMVVLESIMKAYPDISSFLLICVENHKIFTELLSIHKTGQNSPWNATFTFEDYQFLEYFRNFANFFLEGSLSLQREIRGKISMIKQEDFKALVEGRVEECLQKFEQYLQEFSIKKDRDQMSFILRFLEISIQFEIHYKTLLKEVYAGIPLSADKLKERLNKFNDLMLMFHSGNRIAAETFDDNMPSHGPLINDREQLINPLYFFFYVKNYALIRTIRKDYDIPNWLKLLQAMSAWLQHKGEYFKRQKISKIITDQELEADIQRNEDMRLLFVEFAKVYKEG